MEHEHDNHSKGRLYASPKGPATGCFVNFGDLPDAARAHEVRFPGGDSTSEVFQ